MRLLIVEDDSGQRRTLSGLLHREGFKVAVCASLSDAVRLLTQEPFAICVLDLQLEDGHGINVLRQLDDSRTKKTFFIVHTGHGTFSAARDALNLGAFAFVEKLSDPAELLSHVHRAAAEYMRQSLSQAEEEIRFQVRLLDCVQQAVVATDVTGHVIFWNNYAETLYGWRADEAIGQSIDELIVPTQSPVDARNMMDQLRGGQVWQGAISVGHRGGRCFTGEVTDSPILDASHELIGIIGVSRDITQRIETEAALRSSERRYRSVVDGSSEAMIGIGKDGTVETWNQAAQGMFGYAMDEMKGETLSRLMPAELQGECAMLCSRVNSGQAVAGFETQRRTKDGRLLDVSLSLQRILDDAGQPAGIAAIVRDVTAYKRAQQQLQQRESELTHVSRASSMGEMALALTHQLNQPLATAATYAGRSIDLLKTRGVRTGDLLEPLRHSYAQIMHAAEIISRLKSFVSKSKPNLECLDLNDLVRSAEQLMPRMLPFTQVTRRLALQPHAMDVMADGLQIQQVLVNLMSNAFHSIGETGSAEGAICVRTTVTEHGAEVAVIDNGKGIAREQLERVFEPYFSSKQDGMGMGLSICRTIISKHGGRIWAVNNSDAGACVSFTLPLVGVSDASLQEVPDVTSACEITSRTS